MAASLKRSTISFRRQGSSGLAWEENWIPAETDGRVSNTNAPKEFTTTGRDPLQDRNSSSTTASSTSSNFPQLRHSRSVGSLMGAAYTRSRDHRVQSSDAASDLKSAAHAPRSAPGHKSNSRILRWIKRTFSKLAG